MLRRARGGAGTRRATLVAYGLTATGVFMIVMGFMLPFVVYPQLATLPLDPQSGREVRGSGFDVFFPRSVDDGGIRQLWNVDVTSKVYVSEARSGGETPADSPNAHWQVATATYVDGWGLLQTTVEGVSLDRRTALANNCCGDYLLTEEGDTTGTPMPHRGYVFQFPFGVQKKSYPIWDASIKNTADAVYSGTEEKFGLTVYRFEQRVPDQKVGTQDVPGIYFGSRRDSVTADYMYRTARTYWIEPNTGGIVDYQEAMDRRFRYGGKDIPVIRGTLRTQHDPEDATFKLLKTGALGLPLLRWKAPAVLWPLGAVLAVAGVYLSVRGRREQLSRRPPGPARSPRSAP